MKSSPEKGQPHDHNALTGWFCIGGALVGAGVGAVLGHWVIGAIIAGCVGMVVGAVIDRSRR